MMTRPASHNDSCGPIGPGSDARAIVVERTRHAVMAVAKAHTLFSGAANNLSPEHRDLAEDAFALLEQVVRDLRDVVARLEGEEAAAEVRAREARS